MNDSINRRHFLKQAGVAGVGLGLAGSAGFFTPARARDAGMVSRSIGANDRITAAVIGTNGRGLAHIDCLATLPGVDIAYVCDVDDRSIAKGLKHAAKYHTQSPKGIKDFRKVLADKSVDVVTIANSSFRNNTIEFHGNRAMPDYLKTKVNLIGCVFREPGTLDLLVNSVPKKVVTLKTTASVAVAEDFKARVVPGEGKIAVESDLPGLGKN